MFSEYDTYLFHEGRHFNAYNFMGAHVRIENGKRGVRFTTWAPRAKEIAVVGDFNCWNVENKYFLKKISDMGIWSIFIPGIKKKEKYKFAIKGCSSENFILKSDPFARCSELRPNTASMVVASSSYKWNDREWVKSRNKNLYDSPINIYEVHLGSWKKKMKVS